MRLDKLILVPCPSNEVLPAAEGRPSLPANSALEKDSTKPSRLSKAALHNLWRDYGQRGILSPAYYIPSPVQHDLFVT
jgi:hypothetical protein